MNIEQIKKEKLTFTETPDSEFQNIGESEVFPVEQSQFSKSGQRRLRTETLESQALKAMPDELVDALVKYGNNSDGIPALHAAIKAKDEKIVRLLLDHGADPKAKATLDIRHSGLNTALDFAAAYGNENLVCLLIDRGALVNPVTPNDRVVRSTPLMCAAQFNNVATIRSLIRAGADLHAIGYANYLGALPYDALDAAIIHNSGDAIKALISAGVSPDRISANQRTPLMTALENPNGFDSTIEILLKAGADPNFKIPITQCGWPQGKSVLHLVETWGKFSYQEQTNKLELLIQYGADINLCDLNDKTPLSLAADNPFAKILTAHGAKR